MSREFKGVCIKRSKYMAVVQLFEGQPRPSHGGYCVFAEIGPHEVVIGSHITTEQRENGNHYVTAVDNGNAVKTQEYVKQWNSKNVNRD